jgi:DNA-binding response OmpR family regulator
LKKFKILIIDDEKDFVDLIKLILEKNEYIVSVAYDGEEGVNKILAEVPDLVVLDLNIPKLNGYEVCRKVREKYSFTDVAVLMLTVRTLEQDYISGFSCGSDDYMTKPFEPKELLARIRNLMRRAGKIEIENNHS